MTDPATGRRRLVLWLAGALLLVVAAGAVVLGAVRSGTSPARSGLALPTGTHAAAGGGGAGSASGRAGGPAAAADAAGVPSQRANPPAGASESGGVSTSAAARPGATSPSLPAAAGAATTTTTSSPHGTSVASSAPTSLAATAAVSHVRGTVKWGPVCPAGISDPSCAPIPGPAHIQLVRADGTTAAQADAGDDGGFAVSVPPGNYSVKAPGCSTSPSGVTLAPGAAVSVDVLCDTGIR